MIELAKLTIEAELQEIARQCKATAGFQGMFKWVSEPWALHNLSVVHTVDLRTAKKKTFPFKQKVYVGTWKLNGRQIGWNALRGELRERKLID